MEALKTKTGRRIEIILNDGSHDLNTWWPKFFEADLVIGPHGDALSHIIACTEGTAVMEFMVPWRNNGDPAAANIQYEVLATSLGLPYYVTVGDYHEPFAEGGHGDPYFVVDTRRDSLKVMQILDDLEKGEWQKRCAVKDYDVL